MYVNFICSLSIKRLYNKVTEGVLEVPTAANRRIKALTLIAQWSLYVRTASLTFNSTAVCSHSARMCFVWIWEQTAIISLHTINWPIFTTETVCLLGGTDWIYLWRILTLQSPVVTTCTASLTLNNSTFCPRSVCMCFVWISEQTDYFPIQH
jgi:hypothetical protein